MLKPIQIGLNVKILMFLFLIPLNISATLSSTLIPKKVPLRQKNATDRIVKSLDTFFYRLMDTTNIPGISIAITQNDSLVYVRGFGVRNIDTKEPMKSEYLFHVASVSKPFVATAVVQLSEKGKINLDEKLITYLP